MPTPGDGNVAGGNATASTVAPLTADETTMLGTHFFGVTPDGYPVAGSPAVVEIRLEVDGDVLAEMYANSSHEEYV